MFQCLNKLCKWKSLTYRKLREDMYKADYRQSDKDYCHIKSYKVHKIMMLIDTFVPPSANPDYETQRSSNSDET